MGYDYASDPRYQAPDPTGDALKDTLHDVDFILRGADYTGLSTKGYAMVPIPLLSDIHAALSRTPTTEAGVSLEEVREVLLDAEALLCEGVEDSPTVREVLKRVRTILTRIKESK